jgi:hypothetical protein
MRRTDLAEMSQGCRRGQDTGLGSAPSVTVAWELTPFRVYVNRTVWPGLRVTLMLSSCAAMLERAREQG